MTAEQRIKKLEQLRKPRGGNSKDRRRILKEIFKLVFPKLK